MASSGCPASAAATPASEAKHDRRGELRGTPRRRHHGRPEGGWVGWGVGGGRRAGRLAGQGKAVQGRAHPCCSARVHRWGTPLLPARTAAASRPAPPACSACLQGGNDMHSKEHLGSQCRQSGVGSRQLHACCKHPAQLCRAVHPALEPAQRAAAAHLCQSARRQGRAARWRWCTGCSAPPPRQPHPPTTPPAWQLPGGSGQGCHQGCTPWLPCPPLQVALLAPLPLSLPHLPAAPSRPRQLLHCQLGQPPLPPMQLRLGHQHLPPRPPPAAVPAQGPRMPSGRRQPAPVAASRGPPPADRCPCTPRHSPGERSHSRDPVPAQQQRLPGPAGQRGVARRGQLGWISWEPSAARAGRWRGSTPLVCYMRFQTAARNNRDREHDT